MSTVLRRTQPQPRRFAPSTERRSKTVRSIAIAAMIAGYCFIHLLTLAHSPLPWFDDTFFASVAQSVATEGRLALPVAPLWLDKPVYIYGPLYFAVTGVVARVLPFDLYAFRVPCLLFALGVVIVVGLLLRRYRATPITVLSTCALLALDPTFYKSSHGGRMDSMALFFILLSFLTIPSDRSAQKRPHIRLALLSGLFAAIALLTTPRPAYLLIVIAGILMYRVWQERTRSRVVELAAWACVPAASYVLWFLYAFGSIPALMSYYASLPGGQYVGGFSVRLVHVPVLAVLLVLAILSARSKLLANELMFFVAAGALSYYVLVHDPGLHYAFFMVPIAYLGIGFLANTLLSRRRGTVPMLLLITLMTFNVTSYAARNFLVFAQWRATDPAVATNWVAANIPAGSRVVGDDKYYFAVRRTGSDFQYIARGGSIDERIQLHRDRYHAEYLITDRKEQTSLVQDYARGLALTRVSVLPAEPVSPQIQQLLTLARLFYFMPETGYSGSIWVRSVGRPHGSYGLLASTDACYK